MKFLARTLTLVTLLGIAGTANAQVFDVTAGGRIPPIGTSGTADFTFLVSGLSSVTDLDLRLALQHTWDSDLIISVIAPDNSSVTVASSLGSNGDNYQDTLFDDAAATSITAASAPFAGTFQPQNPLSVFNGLSPAIANGTWTLRVTDAASGDSGMLYRVGEAAPWGTALGTALIFNSSASAVPEPGSIALLVGAGVGGLMLRRRKK